MQLLKIWKGSESGQGIIKEADISAENQIVEANYSASEPSIGLLRYYFLWQRFISSRGKISFKARRML
jgi:hypothetical protein